VSEANDVESWIAKQAIRELIDSYCDAINRGDWDRYQAAFAPDAVWEAPALDMRIEGAAAIRETVSSMTSSADVYLQTPSAVVVTLVDTDRATASSTVREQIRTGGDEGMLMLGLYGDELVNTDGGWKFARRRFQLVYMEGIAMAGSAMTARPDLLERPSA
jgi:ketosteroid isomerase-like protein